MFDKQCILYTVSMIRTIASVDSDNPQYKTYVRLVHMVPFRVHSN